MNTLHRAWIRRYKEECGEKEDDGGAKAKWADGWAEGEGEYGFSSLLKQKIKAKKKLLRHLQRRNFVFKIFML